MAKVRFNPQVWINDYAVDVYCDGVNEWEVEDAAVLGLESNTYESDDLRHHPNAPEWVKEWRGPFYVEILDRESGNA